MKNEAAFLIVRNYYFVKQLGLIKREYFTAMAIQGYIAELSVDYADALIKELNE